jgi:hypothetical protein
MVTLCGLTPELSRAAKRVGLNELLGRAPATYISLMYETSTPAFLKKIFTSRGGAGMA